MFVKLTQYDGEAFYVNLLHVEGFRAVGDEDFCCGCANEFVRNAESIVFMASGEEVGVMETPDEIVELIDAVGVEVAELVEEDGDEPAGEIEAA